jgi:hypothetical protein
MAREWTNWKSEDIGIKVNGTPAVTSLQEGRLDVFVRSLDNRLFHRVYENEMWQGTNWRDLSDGHTFDTSPAAVSWSPDRIDLFAVWGKQVQHRSYQSGTWSPWTENLGGITNDAPTAASWKRERVDVLIRSTDNFMSRRFWEANVTVGWKDWENIGGQRMTLTSPPVAVATSPNRIDCFARGANDGHLIHAWYQDGQRQEWTEIDNLTIRDAPAVVSETTAERGRVDVFIRGTDDILRHRIYYTALQPGQPGGTTVYTVMAGDRMWSIARKYNMTPEALMALNPQVRPPDYVIHPGDKIVVASHTAAVGGWEPGSSWDHISMNRIFSAPAAVAWWTGNVLKRIDCFAQDANNNLIHTWWK